MHLTIVESAALQRWPSTGTRVRATSPALVASWAPGVVYAHPLYGKTVSVASRFVTAHRVLGRTVVLVHTVEQLDRGRYWQTRADREGTTVVVRLMSQPPPETSVSLSVDVQLSGAARAAGPVLRWSLPRSARRAVRRLAGQLDAKADASAPS